MATTEDGLSILPGPEFDKIIKYSKCSELDEFKLNQQFSKTVSLGFMEKADLIASDPAGADETIPSVERTETAEQQKPSAYVDVFNKSRINNSASSPAASQSPPGSYGIQESPLQVGVSPEEFLLLASSVGRSALGDVCSVWVPSEELNLFRISFCPRNSSQPQVTWYLGNAHIDFTERPVDPDVSAGAWLEREMSDFFLQTRHYFKDHDNLLKLVASPFPFICKRKPDKLKNIETVAESLAGTGASNSNNCAQTKGTNDKNTIRSSGKCETASSDVVSCKASRDNLVLDSPSCGCSQNGVSKDITLKMSNLCHSSAAPLSDNGGDSAAAVAPSDSTTKSCNAQCQSVIPIVPKVKPDGDSAQYVTTGNSACESETRFVAPVDDVPGLGWHVGLVDLAGDVSYVSEREGVLKMQQSDIICEASDNAYLALVYWGRFIWQRPFHPRFPHIYQIRVPSNESLNSCVLAAGELIENLQLRGHSLAYLLGPNQIFFVGSEDLPALEYLNDLVFTKNQSPTLLSIDPIKLTTEVEVDDSPGEAQTLLYVWKVYDLVAENKDTVDLQERKVLLKRQEYFQMPKHPEECLLRVTSYEGPANANGCWTCSSVDPAKGLRNCAKCKAAWYCSKACQTSDWKRHKPYCKMLVSKALKKAVKLKLD